ncbi:MAG: FitA-like ribbon-helix-helix domain-containing protein [Planctomycetota bacterium]|jgi:plasmid stability protein
MAKLIQIRNVPDKVHRRLKSRAALAGTSLSDYVLRELRRIAELPTREEVLARLPHLDDALSPAPADLVRRERDRR